MKVLFLTDSLSDLDGVGRYAMGLIRALEDEVEDLSVEVLLARKHRPTSASVPARWRAKVGLPPDYFFYMSWPRFWVSFAAGLWHTWRAARRADLVHAIKDYPHNFLGLVAARLAGRPCIATAHGTYTVQPLLDRRHRRLARWTYGRLGGLIAVSGFTARRLLAVLGPDGQQLSVRTIPNCVEVEPLDAPVDVGLQPWHGLRYTLGIGETKERKGHHLALAAWVEVAKQHPNLHHMLVGRLSGDDYERRLRNIAKEAGLEDRVHFLGNVSEAQKIDLLRGAEVFVHTPVTATDGGFEGFGIVYLEASACRRPVIGTQGCGAEDAIADGRTGYLVQPEVEAVAAALARLVGDGALRRRMGDEGRAHALQNTWAKNAAEVLRLYREVLG